MNWPRNKPLNQPPGFGRVTPAVMPQQKEVLEAVRALKQSDSDRNSVYVRRSA